MKFGLTPDQYKFITSEVYEPLSALGAEIYCYGSRSRGDYKDFSDLDLMIEAHENHKAIEQAASQISEKLQNSNFPYKVDLVIYEQFAEAYKAHYEKDKAPWI